MSVLLLENGVDELLLENGLDALLLEFAGITADNGARFARGFVGRRLALAGARRAFRRGFTGRRLREVEANMRKGYAELVQLGVGETRAMVFDFSNFPEVVAGETLSAPSTPAVAGVTFGTPTVLAAAFTYDEDGAQVASGKGVKVNVTGGTAGEYVVRCVVTASGGGTLIVADRLKVVAVT
jgi:hypothetical protein